MVPITRALHVTHGPALAAQSSRVGIYMILCVSVSRQGNAGSRYQGDRNAVHQLPSVDYIYLSFYITRVDQVIRYIDRKVDKRNIEL